MYPAWLFPVFLSVLLLRGLPCCPEARGTMFSPNIRLKISLYSNVLPIVEYKDKAYNIKNNLKGCNTSYEHRILVLVSRKKNTNIIPTTTNFVLLLLSTTDLFYLSLQRWP